MSRHPVSDTLTFEFDVPVAVDQVRIGPNGIVEMMSGGRALSPRHVRAGQHRPRGEKREKSLFSIPLTGPPAMMREAQALAQYRFIFVVDTNTRLIAGTPVSFASVAVCSIRIGIEANGETLLSIVHPIGYEFRGLASEQERLAWLLLQDAIVGSPDFDGAARYLIVTDHAQNCHAAINARDEPLFEDAMLAERLTLGYATSDSGSSITQQILRSCDRNARKFLRDVESGAVDDTNLFALNGGPITHFRGIINTNPGESQTGDIPRFRLNAATPFLDPWCAG